MYQQSFNTTFRSTPGKNNAGAVLMSRWYATCTKRLTSIIEIFASLPSLSSDLDSFMA